MAVCGESRLLEQGKRQFEEKCGADCAELNEDLDRRRRFDRHLQERESKLAEKMALEQRQFEKQKEEDQTRLQRREAELERRLEEFNRQERELDIQERH